MTTLEKLEQYAHDHKIKIIPTPIAGGAAMSSRFRGRKVILIDYVRLQTSAERVRALAHEISHIESGAMNSSYTRFMPPGKLEHKAQVRMIERMLPKCLLYAAIAAHEGRMWEVAEELGMPEDTVRSAARHYRATEE